jgi:uncharacterized membrane protein (UPF0127 family)
MKRESLMIFMAKNVKNNNANMVLLIVVILAIVLVYIRTQPQMNVTPTTQSTTIASSRGLDSEFNVTQITIYSNGSNSTYYAYFPVNLSQEEQGYMNQTSIGDCRGMSPCIGMLFLFNYSQDLCFWMDNTEIALNQVWIASNGTITGEYIGTPYSKATICYTAQAVLETLPNTTILSTDKIYWK